MTIKERALKICNELKRIYPEAKCTLNYSKPYELVIATRLSAQCTDARVNIVTDTLFKRYTTLESFADSDINELESYIRPCGFYKTKAKNIKDMCKELTEHFDGVVPDNIESLVSLPGVGRKTANLIVGDIYGKPAIVTDTHCIRIAGRLGLTDSNAPHKVENDLKAVIPEEEGSDFCHRIVEFGREVCKARKPMCNICTLNSVCRYNIENKKGER